MNGVQTHNFSGDRHLDSSLGDLAFQQTQYRAMEGRTEDENIRKLKKFK
jgi:hypothetical protein